MQSLWSSAGAAQSTCRCVSCLSTTASGITSRSAAAASKRRLRIGNSVTALYTSIFAAAALADARAKDKRRHDWDEKIATVKAEVKELIDEEERILETLESRRKNRGLQRLVQSRGFGTTGVNSRVNSPTMRHPGRTPVSTRSFHTERRLLNSVAAQVSESSSTEAENSVDSPAEEDLITTPGENVPDWVLGDPLRLKAIQTLALRQFTIRLLLRPTIAHRYSGISMNYKVDPSVPHRVDVQGLLDELNRLRHRIDELKTHRESNFDNVVQEYVAFHLGKKEKGCENLDAELHQDLDLFMSQRMSLQELILRISNNLLDSVDPDRTAAFRYMIMALTRARQNDVVQLLLRTMLPNHFYLSSSLIVTILAFLRNSKDLKNFDLFLQMLSGRGYPVNLGRIGRYNVRKINGIDTVVPPLDSNNPTIYAVLISAALRFDQPERADAWLQAARSAGFFDNAHTLSAYLRFYSIRQDWEKGTHVLKRALTFMVSSTDLAAYDVERLLLRMVHLCDSCSRKDASEALITTAVHSGFEPEIPLAYHDIVPIVDPKCQRWSKAEKTAPLQNFSRPLWQKCYDFANTFGEHLSRLEVPEDATTASRTVKMAGMHAQHCMSTTLAGSSSYFNRSRSDEEAVTGNMDPGATPESQSTPEQTTQAEDITALKDEVAQLRELVFELRKHHIENSFPDDDGPGLERPEPLPQPIEQSSTDTDTHTPRSWSVEFARISSTGSETYHTHRTFGRHTRKSGSRSNIGNVPGLGSMK